MNKEMRSLLIPQYVKEFKCIGGNCEDSCCNGWRVDIDKETYNKYKELNSIEIAPLIKKYISKNRHSNNDENNYGKIKLENGECPFLDEEKLCRIQLEKGHTYLSKVCTTYPRITNIIDGALEKSLTMSCPEAVRLALLNPLPMEFDQTTEELNTIYTIAKNFNSSNIKNTVKGSKYFWDLRIFTISLLQNRNYLLQDRLIILGMFINKVQETVDSNNLGNIPEITIKYQQYIDNGDFKESLNGIPVQSIIQMKLIKEITDKRYFLEVNNKRYLECLEEFLNGINFNDEPLEDIGQRYVDAYNKYYLPFDNEHSYILENYLVNYVFKNIFPYNSEKNLFNSYMMMIIHYAMIKMHLIGMAAHHKYLTEELVVKLIQSFAKTIEHNTQFLKGIENLMRKNKLNTMPYMAILIKN